MQWIELATAASVALNDSFCSCPHAKGVSFLGESCDGLHDCCTVGYMVFDEIDHPKKCACLLEVCGW